MEKMNKRGEAFADLGRLAIGVVTLAIILTIGFIVMSQGQQQILETDGVGTNVSANCVDSAGCNATAELITSVDDLPTWVPLLIIVGVGVILLSMVKLLMRK